MKLSEPTDSKTVPGLEDCPRYIGVKVGSLIRKDVFNDDL